VSMVMVDCFRVVANNIALSARLEQTRDELRQLIGEKNWEEARVACVRLKYLDGVDTAIADALEKTA
jgi:DnaJ-domain-containing protein 1